MPVVTGASVFSNLPINVVLVADPGLALSESLPLAWYASLAHGVRTQDVLATAISAIARALKSKTTIFFGASGGGFAALYHAWRMPGSLALPINPQTDIANYSPRYVKEYAQTFLTAKNPEDVPRALKEDVQSNLLPLYETGYDNHVLYLQNISDWHVEKHMEPFMEACARRVPRIMGTWGDGHVAPPTDTIRNVVGELLAEPFDGWERAIARVADPG